MFRTANDFVDLVEQDGTALTDRAKYYRALAALLRSQVPGLKSVDSQNELLGLAASYDMLAAQFEASQPPKDTSSRD